MEENCKAPSNKVLGSKIRKNSVNTSVWLNEQAIWLDTSPETLWSWETNRRTEMYSMKNVQSNSGTAAEPWEKTDQNPTTSDTRHWQRCRLVHSVLVQTWKSVATWGGNLEVSHKVKYDLTQPLLVIKQRGLKAPKLTHCSSLHYCQHWEATTMSVSSSGFPGGCTPISLSNTENSVQSQALST